MLLTTKTKEPVLAFSFTANPKLNDFKPLSDAIDIEIMRNAYRKDMIFRLGNFRAIVETIKENYNVQVAKWVGWKKVYATEVRTRDLHTLALQHKASGNVYQLTDSSIRHLFTKVAYNNKLNALIPENLKQPIINALNDKKRAFYRMRDVPAIKQEFYHNIGQIDKTLFALSKEIDINLVAKILNHAIFNLPVGIENLQFRFQQVAGKNYIRAILDEKYKVFNNIDILKQLQLFSETNDNTWHITRLYSDIFGNFFEIRISMPFQSKEDAKINLQKRHDEKGISGLHRVVKPEEGEPIEYSMAFSNSETGSAPVFGEVGIYVLKCTNGLTALTDGDSFSLIHNRNDGSLFIESVKILMKQAVESWKTLEEKYNSAKNILVDDPKALIESICEDFTLGQKISEQIYQQFRDELKADEERRSNLFKVVDAFTAVAHKHYDLSQDGFRKLESIGSQVLMNYTKFADKLLVSAN